MVTALCVILAFFALAGLINLTLLRMIAKAGKLSRRNCRRCSSHKRQARRAMAHFDREWRRFNSS